MFCFFLVLLVSLIKKKDQFQLLVCACSKLKSSQKTETKNAIPLHQLECVQLFSCDSRGQLCYFNQDCVLHCLSHVGEKPDMSEGSGTK